LDWDAAERGRGFLDQTTSDDLNRQLNEGEHDPGAGLIHLPNKHYFGAVFLTERNAAGLKMLVNREGFVPDAAYDTLVSLVRTGIDLSTRVQAAASQELRSERRSARAAGKEPNTVQTRSLTPSTVAIESALKEATTSTREAKRLAAGGHLAAASKQIATAIARIETIANAPDELIHERSMLLVLASVGTQLASFVHEINGLLTIANSADKSVSSLRQSTGLSVAVKRELASLNRTITDLRRALERQASYLIDIVAPDARRRRSRQSISERFDSAAKLVSFAADKKSVKIINDIGKDLRSPPMFPAELTAVFSNLLSNAVKAAGQKGRIRARGRALQEGACAVRVENSGVRVNVRDGERWFKPFESSTTDVDPILGQGMGLGLPITRNILEEYGATIKFVESTGGYSTAIEIVFPGS
jgi:signal transduction histidine kinase